MKEDKLYLRHILECVRRIRDDTSGGRDEFLKSHTSQDAVLRNLQTLAGSTQRLSDELRRRHPEIEWRQIAAFRNILVHNYLGIDMERIWAVLEHDVPRLADAVTMMLNDLGRSDP